MGKRSDRYDAVAGEYSRFFHNGLYPKSIYYRQGAAKSTSWMSALVDRYCEAVLEDLAFIKKTTRAAIATREAFSYALKKAGAKWLDKTAQFANKAMNDGQTSVDQMNADLAKYNAEEASIRSGEFGRDAKNWLRVLYFRPSGSATTLATRIASPGFEMFPLPGARPIEGNPRRPSPDAVTAAKRYLYKLGVKLAEKRQGASTGKTSAVEKASSFTPVKASSFTPFRTPTKVAAKTSSKAATKDMTPYYLGGGVALFALAYFSLRR